MSYIEDVNIQWQDTGNIDAFGRARVSELTTQFDAKQIYDNLPLFIDTVTNGTGLSTHSTIEANSQLSTLLSGDYVISQTKQRFNYQSGKSQLIFMTCNNFDTQTNITKRIGYFSSSTAGSYTADFDGLFIESGINVSINVYKTGTEVEKTFQSSWNLDRLDGTGKSGINIDWDKNIIFVVDFEWRVRWGVIVNGLITYFHESNHANVTTGVYMSSPNQPLRWEIRQNGVGSGSFNYICASVNSEGSINKLGKILSVNNGDTHVNANNTNNTYILHAIRLNSTNLDTLVDVLSFNSLSVTNDAFLWSVVLNPSIKGALSFTTLTRSSLQHAVGSTQTITGGTVLDSGYVSAQSGDSKVIDNAVRLGSTIGGVSDILTFCVRPLSSNLDVYGAISWRELI